MMTAREAADTNPRRRLRVAMFSPLPPQQSGVADYTAELLPHLASRMDLTLFAPHPKQVAMAVRSHYPVLNMDAYSARRTAYDVAVYHIGNSEFHDEIAQFALRYPGVVVLHDFFLHHATAQRTIGAGNFAAYAREMAYAYGAAGIGRAFAVRAGEMPAPTFSAPLNERLLDSSLGVIGHSAYAAAQVREQGFERPLQIVPAPIAMLPGTDRRAELGLLPEDVLLASFGLITAEKQIESVFRCLRDLRRRNDRAHYLLVGRGSADIDLDALIAHYALQGCVHQIGFVPELEAFVDWIHTADIVVNLRHPTAGETSATALRALAAGKPLVVNQSGWYAELPDDVVVKVPPQKDDVLLRALQLLVDSPQARHDLSTAARAYIEANHTVEKAAEAYETAIKSILRRYGARFDRG